MTPQPTTQPANYIARTPNVKANNPLADDSTAALMHAWTNGLVTKIMGAAEKAERLTFGGLEDGETFDDLKHTIARDLALSESRAQLALEVFHKRADLLAEPSRKAGVLHAFREMEKHLARLRAALTFLNSVSTRPIIFPQP